MTPATLLPPNDLAVLLVGDPGCRKTTLALQFPKPYIFDADSNISAPVNHLLKSNPAIASTIFYDKSFVDSDGKEIPVMDRYIHMTKCLNLAAADPNIRTIICDSFTAIVDILINECKRQAARPESAEMRIQDWGQFARLTKNLVTKLRASGKITVFTGHNKVEKDDADGQWKYFLSLPGQCSTVLSGLFTDVWNPYPAINGIGANQTYLWRIRTMPASLNDHRGFKSSFGFKTVEDYDTVVKHVKTLV